MKTLLVVLAVALGISQANAQRIKSNEVPDRVKKELEQNFNVKDADWDKEGENYEASFEQKGSEISVVFGVNGLVLETEYEIDKKELPTAVLEALKRDYKDYKIEEAARIESNGILTYEAEVEKAEQTFDLIFDAQGKLLKKVTFEEDES